MKRYSRIVAFIDENELPECDYSALCQVYYSESPG